MDHNLSDELYIPGKEPSFDDHSTLDHSGLRLKCKLWVAWWCLQQQIPEQANARRALLHKAVEVGLGERVKVHHRLRWVTSVFSFLSDTPTTLRAVNQVRGFMVGKVMSLATKSHRGAIQLIPNPESLAAMDPADAERMSRTVQSLASTAYKGYELIGKLLHLDKTPPDLDLTGQQAEDVLSLLPRAFDSMDDNQLKAVINMAKRAREPVVLETDTRTSKAGL